VQIALRLPHQVHAPLYLSPAREQDDQGKCLFALVKHQYMTNETAATTPTMHSEPRVTGTAEFEGDKRVKLAKSGNFI
jgi:hypothetical protein